MDSCRGLEGIRGICNIGCTRECAGPYFQGLTCEWALNTHAYRTATVVSAHVCAMGRSCGWGLGRA